MKIFFLFLLLGLVAQSAAQELPTAEQVRAWAGFPSELSLRARSARAEDEKNLGTLVAGMHYSSDKTRYSYSIKLFAPDSFLHGRREELLSKLKKFQERKPGSGPWSDIGFHETSNGQSFYIMPGGGGPGGGSTIAFATTKQFDVVVEEHMTEEGHPLDKTHEEGIRPSSTLARVFEATLAFLIQRAADAPQ